MIKLLHTRPFNLEHAKAGAPFCCANGDEVEILKWDRKHTICIIGLARQDAAVRKWRADGSYEDVNSAAFQLVMTPLGFVDEKPVFVGDEIVSEKDGRTHVAYPEQRNFAGARWPDPAPVYPETRMRASDLHAVYLNAMAGTMGNKTFSHGHLAIANAAIRHAIDAGQVAVAVVSEDPDHAPMTKEAYDLCSRDLGIAEQLLESLGWRSAGNGQWLAPGTGDAHLRAARDMAIAKAVQHVCMILARDMSTKHSAYIGIRDGLQLSAIIAGVKP